MGNTGVLGATPVFHLPAKGGLNKKLRGSLHCMNGAAVAGRCGHGYGEGDKNQQNDQKAIQLDTSAP